MFSFLFGFLCGYIFFRFKAPLLSLINRATSKAENELNKTFKS